MPLHASAPAGLTAWSALPNLTLPGRCLLKSQHRARQKYILFNLAHLAICLKQRVDSYLIIYRNKTPAELRALNVKKKILGVW